jgi:hypothetical protein
MMIFVQVFQQTRHLAHAAAEFAAQAWLRAINFTGARGGAWLVGALIVADALAVAVCRGDGGGERGCWFPSTRDVVTATRNSQGGWSVRPLTEDSYVNMWSDGNVQIMMGSTRCESTGIWSPWLTTEHGRSAHLMAPGSTTTAEEQAIRQALIDAWPTLSGVPGADYAKQPLRPDEIEAIKVDQASERTSINWLWLMNDLLVLTAGVLICGSHPARAARWRLNAQRQLVEFRCFSCRYGLGGLPMSAQRECRCPECGCVNVAAT